MIYHGQLSLICGLLIGELKTVIYVIPFHGHLISQKVAKTYWAAEILAAGAAID